MVCLLCGCRCQLKWKPDDSLNGMKVFTFGSIQYLGVCFDIGARGFQGHSPEEFGEIEWHLAAGP